MICWQRYMRKQTACAEALCKGTYPKAQREKPDIHPVHIAAIKAYADSIPHFPSAVSRKYEAYNKNIAG